MGTRLINRIGLFIPIEFFFWLVPTMSFSSKPKKIKAKGTFCKLKIVQTVSRKGNDTIKTEEVKTLCHGVKNGPSTSHSNHSLSRSSPMKRSKMEPVDEEPIPILWNMDGPVAFEKRHMLVFAYSP